MGLMALNLLKNAMYILLNLSNLFITEKMYCCLNMQILVRMLIPFYKCLQNKIQCKQPS